MRSIRAYGAELMVVEDGVDYMDEAARLERQNAVLLQHFASRLIW